MKIGLVGLPNSGKTTIFNALTKSQAAVTAYAGTKVEPNVAIVPVGDERVSRLSAMYKPKKTIYASIEVVDFVGLKEGSSKDEAMAAELVRLIKNVDALAMVVRNFSDDAGAAPNPLRDLKILTDEFVLADLIVVEKRLERIRASQKKGIRTALEQLEEKVLERVAVELNAERPLRDLELSPEEEKAIRGFGFLTRKPAFVIVNSQESNFGKNAELIDEFQKLFPTVEFAGSFEMELAQLDNEDDARAFMQDMGITESARDRLTRIAYATLGYISFFTVGDDEVRAWNVKRGAPAVDAAGTIHTDLARGFIRAECMSYADLAELGSEKAVKEKGRLRLEGRDYVVKDGDILTIRYNV
jgi:hypothetical protein